MYVFFDCCVRTNVCSSTSYVFSEPCPKISQLSFLAPFVAFSWHHFVSEPNASPYLQQHLFAPSLSMLGIRPITGSTILDTIKWWDFIVSSGMRLYY